MADPPTGGGARDRDDAGSDGVVPAGAPRWVVRFWLVALVAVVLIVLHVAAGGGFRHHGGP